MDAPVLKVGETVGPEALIPQYAGTEEQRDPPALGDLRGKRNHGTPLPHPEALTSWTLARSRPEHGAWLSAHLSLCICRRALPSS